MRDGESFHLKYWLLPLGRTYLSLGKMAFLEKNSRQLTINLSPKLLAPLLLPNVCEQ